MLFEDPLLEPIDRNVWVAIEMLGPQAVSTEGLMALCSANLGTIIRSLSILRSTAWLTIVNAGGWQLNEEPLQLTETMHLDDCYLPWLEETAAGAHSKHPRAIAAAKNILRDIRDQIQAGEDVRRIQSPLDRRLQAMQFLESRLAGHAEGRFYNVSALTVKQMGSPG